MSHNKIKVAGQEPSASGEISLDINNLNDVNISVPSNNDYLKYNSSTSQWEPSATATSTQNEIEHIWIGEGASVTYPENWTTNNNAYFYSSSVPENTITGATVSSSDSYSNWYDTFNLPAGSYFIYTRVQATYTSSSGYLQYRIKYNGSTVAPRAYAVANGNSSEVPQLIQSIIELSSATDVTINLTTVSSASSPGSNQSEYGFILIQRIF